jgi:hypothetical protein
MGGPQEVEYRVTSMLYDGRANVTNSAQQLKTIFSALTSIQNTCKSIVLTNNSANTIFFGATNATTIGSAGGMIYAGASREIPLYDLNYSPYFIAVSNSELGIEVWA